MAGIDISDKCGDFLASYDIPFLKVDLTDKPSNFGTGKFDAVYCRFMLHAVPEDVEDFILSESFNVIKSGGLLCIESRSDQGHVDYAHGDHYRRHTNYKALQNKVDSLGFDILWMLEKDGLSRYLNENPVIIRMVCKKP